MKIVITVIMLILTGCTSIEVTEKDVDRNSKAYREAKALYDRDAKKEFERNKRKGNLVFYALAFHLEDEGTTPGLTQEEVDLFIEERKIGFHVIHNDISPFFVGRSKAVQQHYWIVVDDFMKEYNQLVLEEYKNKGYQGASHNDGKPPRES